MGGHLRPARVRNFVVVGGRRFVHGGVGRHGVPDEREWTSGISFPILAQPVRHDLMIDPETLLAAVSDDNPCGEDVAYDPKFLELETLIAGKPETQFSAAEEPDWKAMREACLALLARSKHLRVATLLALALV